MTRLQSRLGVLAAGAVLCFLAFFASAQAAEEIRSFDAMIELSSDGVLKVTEDIRVKAERNQIRRGIFRDIPLVFEKDDGSRGRAGFKLLSVERDGEAEPYRVDTSNDGVRIYIGDKNRILKPDFYRYTITYETTRQVRFFEDHDEVYWNVTGNQWAFPIREASALVVLPDGVSAQKWVAYTGSYGATSQDYQASTRGNDNQVTFETTKALGAGEGLTIAVAFPKGAVTPPTEAEQWGYYLADNRMIVLGGAGLVLVLIYYAIAWWRVGRDPKRGVVYPRFEPLKDISPALANYIENRGFSGSGWTALSAACLNLAVKDRLVLDEEGEDLVLSLKSGPSGSSGPWGRRSAEARDLAPGEAVIHTFLRNRDGDFAVSKSNGPSVVKLGNLFRSAIERENRDRYFKANRLFSVAGVGLSILVLILIFVFGNLSSDEIGLTLPILMVGVFFAVLSVAIGKQFRKKSSLASRIGSAMVLFFVLSVLLAIGGSLITAALDVGSSLPIIVALLVAVNVFFVLLMGAPTALGREALDKIEGLRLYMEVAEAERMNMKGAPRMSPQHFEDLLPYAVALGVEKPWAQAFQTWLETAASTVERNYHPRWRRGGVFNAHNIAGSLAGTTSAMAQSFSSSVPAPKSSSSGFSSGGGGGGFSGGGGGGGGGGGW